MGIIYLGKQKDVNFYYKYRKMENTYVYLQIFRKGPKICNHMCGTERWCFTFPFGVIMGCVRTWTRHESKHYIMMKTVSDIQIRTQTRHAYSRVETNITRLIILLYPLVGSCSTSRLRKMVRINSTTFY